MKPFFLSLLFLLLCQIGFSQITDNTLELSPDDKFYYLDSTSTQTNSKDYQYIRVIKDSKLKKESYTVLEYYRSGQLRMEGSSKFFDGYSKEGKVTYYYKNGTKKSETNYIKGRVNGKDFEWYENGTKKLEGEYIEDSKKRTTEHKTYMYWDENGVKKVVDGNGECEENDDHYFGKGTVKNGLKDGNWQGWFINPKIKYNEYYNNGKFVSGTTTNENGTETTYDALEKKPEPKNGIMSFYKYIGKNYSTSKFPKGLKGKIYVSFIVDKEGKLVDPKILRDIGYGSGEEAIRVLNMAENWNPGEQRGRKVRVLYSLPITIQTAN